MVPVKKEAKISISRFALLLNCSRNWFYANVWWKGSRARYFAVNGKYKIYCVTGENVRLIELNGTETHLDLHLV